MNMKKLVSMVLALVMVMAMMVPAMAEEAGTYTLTLNGAFEGHTYTAYQIFAGELKEVAVPDTVDGTQSVLSNITWGSGVSAAGQTALGNAADKAETLTNAQAAEAFAAEVSEYLDTEAGSATVAEGANTCTISGLEPGYYLIKTTNVTAENGVYTYYIMEVIEDSTATVKADYPEVDKTVDDNDANIGDTVTFTLTATMPSTFAGYESYKVIFHDTMSAGLAFKEITSVKVGDKELTADQYTATTGTVTDEDGNATGETTLTVTIADVLTHGATANGKVTVTYTAIVDADAVIGTAGNPNKVYLEYSNNPNWDGEGDEPTGDTPEEEVKVYTWEIPVFKYTGTNTPLAGAGFTLYTDADCTTAVNLVATNDATIYKVCTQTDCVDHTHVTEITTGATGKFQIEGLQKGTYYLKETTTPAGYNTAAVVTVVIGENGALTQNGTATNEVGILNQTGATLPETGGMGTTMMYIGGGLLVAFAVIMLVTKRRMNAAE